MPRSAGPSTRNGASRSAGNGLTGTVSGRPGTPVRTRSGTVPATLPDDGTPIPAPLMVACGAQANRESKGTDKLGRPVMWTPKCNRPSGHLGDHIQSDRTAMRLATWTNSSSPDDA